MSLAKTIGFLRRLQDVGDIAQESALQAYSPTGRPANVLRECVDFGSNPGNLRMLDYVPENIATHPALVVVLHGCGQTPIGYDIGSGWSSLAARYGFALLMPGQQSSNNPNACFNWFDRDDTERDRGEAMSIRQMIAAMGDRHGIDPRRIFITGLSAGGAMANAMLAAYPEVFAGGAIVAGLPYGLAGNVRQALSLMMRPRPHTGPYLGERIRRASSHGGPWPRIAIWQGTADQTVHPANADELLKQWLDVHGLPPAPMSHGTIDGQARDLWWGEDGRTLVESFTIDGLAHGAPLGTGGDDRPYGAAAPFMIDAGISSTWHIADFFGLTGRASRPAATPANAPHRPRAPKRSAKRPALEVGDAINRALTAAGLIKRDV